MPLVALQEVYADANRHRYAVGHFNISNLEFTQAAIAAAVGKQAPVILGVSAKAIEYAGLCNLVAMVRSEARRAPVPVTLHLDHGPTAELAVSCVDAGFTSVMIDGSHLPLAENIRLTRAVVDYAHPRGVSVEAELGRLGGIEDSVSVEERDACLTDPDEAERFVAESGCDALAVAVGTSHGAYKFKGEARLDFDRIETLKKRLGIPLVLHGASGVGPELVASFRAVGGQIKDARGVPDEAYHRAIACGINKINVDTDLRLAFTAAVRGILAEQPELFDPRGILKAGRAAVERKVAEKIGLFGSAGRARPVTTKRNAKAPCTA